MSDITFEDFYQSFESGKRNVIIQTVIGRSGSLFIQSLLDNHDEILMYPGILNCYCDLFTKIQYPDYEKTLLIHFESLKDLMYPYNIDKNLGENENDAVEIDHAKILAVLRNDCKNSNDRKKLFIALHYAFGVYFQKDLSEVKYIYCHEHTIDLSERWIAPLLSDFPNAIILCSVRDPATNVASIENWLSKRKYIHNPVWQNSFFQNNLFPECCIYWYINGVLQMKQFAKNIVVLRLEDVQRQRSKYVFALANMLGIKFLDSLLVSTFHQKKWNGDIFSSKQNGFRDTAIKLQKTKTLRQKMHEKLIEIQLFPERKCLNYCNGLHRPGFLGKMLPFFFYALWYREEILKLFNIKYYFMKRKVYNLSLFKSFFVEINNQTISIRTYYKSLLSVGHRESTIALNILQCHEGEN